MIADGFASLRDVYMTWLWAQEKRGPAWKP
jgi:hypothetical protein